MRKGVERTVGYIREVLGQEPYPQTALALLCGLAELREPSLGMEVRRYGGGPLQEGVHTGAGPEFGDRASADAGGERVRRERRRMGNMRSGRSRRSRRRCRERLYKEVGRRGEGWPAGRSRWARFEIGRASCRERVSSPV